MKASVLLSLFLVQSHQHRVSTWKLIISRWTARNFTRNPIVNSPCRNRYVDEFINIGVYTFIPYTRGITAFDRNLLYLIGWSLSSPRACITSCTQASYKRSLPLKRDKIKLAIYSSAAAKMSSPPRRLKARVNYNSITVTQTLFWFFLLSLTFT